MVQLKCGYLIRKGVAASKCIQTSAENDELLDVPVTNSFGEFGFGKSTPGGNEESKAPLLRLFLSSLEQFLGSESRYRYGQRILEDGSPLYKLMSGPVGCRNEGSSAWLARQHRNGPRMVRRSVAPVDCSRTRVWAANVPSRFRATKADLSALRNGNEKAAIQSDLF